MELEAQSSKYTANHSGINVEDKIISLFEPDPLLPAQYLENLRRKTLLEPEKRLMLAVLEDAINCFQVNVMAQSGRRKKLFNEAEIWIMEHDNDWIFSFVNVCELLQFNPEYLRRGLLRWKEKKLARNPTPHSWGEKMIAGYSSVATGRSSVRQAHANNTNRIEQLSCSAFAVRHQKIERGDSTGALETKCRASLRRCPSKPRLQRLSCYTGEEQHNE